MYLMRNKQFAVIQCVCIYACGMFELGKSLAGSRFRSLAKARAPNRQEFYLYLCTGHLIFIYLLVILSLFIYWSSPWLLNKLLTINCNLVYKNHSLSNDSIISRARSLLFVSVCVCLCCAICYLVMCLYPCFLFVCFYHPLFSFLMPY
jgi:hypothetical protein